MSTPDPNQWSVFVQGIDATFLVVSVADTEDAFLKTTIRRFKEIVRKMRPEVEPEHMRLLFAGKQLEEKKKGAAATLGDYKIKRNSTLHLVIRMPGGTTRDSLPRPGPPEEKLHDRSDFSLKFTTTKPDCLDPFPDPDAPPRVEMSCGHAVDPNMLTGYTRSMVDQGEFELKCPAIVTVDAGTNELCGKIWEYTEVRKVALLDDAECRWFESKIAERAALQYCDMKECPGCRSFVERADPTNLRVHCIVCSKKKATNYDFCWNCKSEWSGPNTSAIKCGRDDCEHANLPDIRDAPIIKVANQDVPNRRACPTCGNVIEHTGEDCKMITCKRCQVGFCFLCLEVEAECLRTSPGSWEGRCFKPVAPVQTAIPVWDHQASSNPERNPCTII